MRWVALVAFAMACGRIGFDPVEPEVHPLEPGCTLAVETRALGITDARDLSLAAGPSELALAYWSPSTSKVGVQRLAPTGAAIGTATLLSGAGASVFSGGPSITWNGTEYAVLRSLAMATQNGPVLVTRLDANGAPVAADTTISTMGWNWGSASLAWNGSRYGATWLAFGATETGGWFAPIGDDATRLAPGAQATGAGDCLCLPRLAWTGSHWAIVFENDGIAGQLSLSVGLTLVSPDGVLAGPPVLVSDPGGVALDPTIASNGATLAVAWSAGGTDLLVANVAPSGARSATSLQPAAAPRSPDLATLPDGFAAVWGDPGGIMMWLFDTDVSPTADPVQIAASTSVGMSRRALATAVLDGVLDVAWVTDAGVVSLTRVGCQ